MRGSHRQYTSAFVAISLLASSAASAAPTTVDPLVALSVFGTSESRAAICAGGASAAAAAGAAVAAQAGTAGGCVLPVMDAPPPAPVASAPPPPVVAVAPAVAQTGIGALPLLLGLAAIAAVGIVLIKNTDGDGEINLPISP